MSVRTPLPTLDVLRQNIDSLFLSLRSLTLPTAQAFDRGLPDGRGPFMTIQAQRNSVLKKLDEQMTLIQAVQLPRPSRSRSSSLTQE